MTSEETCVQERGWRVAGAIACAERAWNRGDISEREYAGLVEDIMKEALNGAGSN